MKSESTQSRGQSSSQKPKEGPNYYPAFSQKTKTKFGQKLSWRIIQKAKELLDNKETYIPVSMDPIQKLDKLIKWTLNKLIKKGQITKEEQCWMKSSGPILLRSVDTPKYTSTTNLFVQLYCYQRPWHTMQPKNLQKSLDISEESE